MQIVIPVARLCSHGFGIATYYIAICNSRTSMVDAALVLGYLERPGQLSYLCISCNDYFV